MKFLLLIYVISTGAIAIHEMPDQRTCAKVRNEVIKVIGAKTKAKCIKYEEKAKS